MSNRVLGIDPGMALMGYGVIDAHDGELSAILYGALSTPSGQAVPQRLHSLYWGLIDLLDRYQPSAVAVELFVARNLKTSLLVGQARGVAILAAANKGIQVYEYTPLQIKLSVSGYGRGDKKQVQEMVKLQLGLPSVPQPDDAADALAAALCHLGQTRLARLMNETELRIQNSK